MTKLQITLTDQETNLLAEKAQLLGYDVTKYAKFVLAKDAASALDNIPTYVATDNMNRLISQGLKEADEGKTKTWKFG